MSMAARRKVEDLKGKYSGRGGQHGATVHTSEVLADLDQVATALDQKDAKAHQRRQAGLDRALTGEVSPEGVRRR